MNNYLLDAVDKLTLNHFTKVPMTKTVGPRDELGELLDPTNSIDIACISDVDHEPLLLQLRDAVAGGIGSKGGSSDGSARIPFDPGALALFDSIGATVNAWYRTVPDHREERNLTGRLRDWYVDHSNRARAGKIDEITERAALKTLEGWVRSIEAMFDPPETQEVTDPCPACGGRYAIDPKTGDRITALILEFRNLGNETLDKTTGLCRSCLTVWRGGHGMREMRWAIDNEPGEHITVEGYTVEQLLSGIDSALEVRNMKAAASLVNLLGVVEPDTAAKMRGIAAALVAKDERERATNRKKAS